MNLVLAIEVSKFKVGDYLFHTMFDHDTPCIVKDVSDSYYILYKDIWADGGCKEFSISWVESTLHQIKVANTAITRKLYPHYKEDGDWLICTEKNS